MECATRRICIHASIHHHASARTPRKMACTPHDRRADAARSSPSSLCLEKHMPGLRPGQVDGHRGSCIACDASIRFVDTSTFALKTPNGRHGLGTAFHFAKPTVRMSKVIRGHAPASFEAGRSRGYSDRQIMDVQHSRLSSFPSQALSAGGTLRKESKGGVVGAVHPVDAGNQASAVDSRVRPEQSMVLDQASDRVAS